MMKHSRVKFPHSPILHYAFSSWRVKTTIIKVLCEQTRELTHDSLDYV